MGGERDGRDVVSVVEGESRECRNGAGVVRRACFRGLRSEVCVCDGPDSAKGRRNGEEQEIDSSPGPWNKLNFDFASV